VEFGQILRCLQAALIAVATGLALAAVMWPRWVEAAFHATPDAGDGSLEWGLAGAIFLVLVVLLSISKWRSLDQRLPERNAGED
jgi:hypothetical protein